jgi:hypothetical protein
MTFVQAAIESTMHGSSAIFFFTKIAARFDKINIMAVKLIQTQQIFYGKYAAICLSSRPEIRPMKRLRLRSGPFSEEKNII